MSGNTRSLPSTVWATLSMPSPPVGSIPFVDTDGSSIITDIAHFFYTALGALSSSAAFNRFPYQLTAWGGIRMGGVILTGITGTITVNAPAGSVTIPAGTFLLTVHCSYVKFGATIVIPTLRTLDNTLTRLIVSTVANGQFILFGNAAATADVNVDFVVFNIDTTGP